MLFQDSWRCAYMSKIYPKMASPTTGSFILVLSPMFDVVRGVRITSDTGESLYLFVLSIVLCP